MKWLNHLKVRVPSFHEILFTYVTVGVENRKRTDRIITNSKNTTAIYFKFLRFAHFLERKRNVFSKLRLFS